MTNKYKYSSFGESAALSGTTFGFQGQRYDAETGLYYMKMRYYDPKTGRFLQPDPIGYGDGLNIYQFAYNNPNNFSDPLGLAADGSLLGSDTGSFMFPGSGFLTQEQMEILITNGIGWVNPHYKESRRNERTTNKRKKYAIKPTNRWVSSELKDPFAELSLGELVDHSTFVGLSNNNYLVQNRTIGQVMEAAFQHDQTFRATPSAGSINTSSGPINFDATIPLSSNDILAVRVVAELVSAKSEHTYKFTYSPYNWNVDDTETPMYVGKTADGKNIWFRTVFFNYSETAIATTTLLGWGPEG